MEKYAVVLTDEVTKIAEKAGKCCPQCGGSQVSYRTLTPYCEVCGTEPWEKNEQKDRRK